jgi:hypothetical protein
MSSLSSKFAPLSKRKRTVSRLVECMKAVISLITEIRNDKKEMYWLRNLKHYAFGVSNLLSFV